MSIKQFCDICGNEMPLAAWPSRIAGYPEAYPVTLADNNVLVIRYGWISTLNESKEKRGDVCFSCFVDAINLSAAENKHEKGETHE